MNPLHRSEPRRSGATDAALRRRTIVLWGDAGSGKSGFIGALHSEAAKTVGERWTLDLDDATADVTTYAESASLALRLRDVKAVTVRRPDRAFTIPVRRWAGKRATRAVDLTVLDPQGSVAAAPADQAATQTIAATTTADGILWLLAPPAAGVRPPPHDRVPLLRQVIAMLQAARAAELSIPVAVALTKIDRLPAAEMRRCLESPDDVLRATLGDAAFGWLLAAFPRLHCCAFTAAGTVRNAARPVGLTTTLDWFADEWRRAEEEAHASRTRARRSARVARVRHRAPVAAAIAASAAIIAFAGVAAARLLGQRESTWSSAAGSVAVQGDPVRSAPAAPPPTVAETPSLAAATAALRRGDAISALRDLAGLRVPDSSRERYAADSLLALAAVRGTEDAFSTGTPPDDLLRLVLSSTSGAIARAHPGAPILAPLSLARAGACVGGRLDCPAEQVREDLAWALLLGTPGEQDQARRLRAAIVGDAPAMAP
jgi:hypothetical protein